MRRKIITHTATGTRINTLYSYARTWIRQGFTPGEAREIRQISPDGLKSPAFQALLSSRSDKYEKFFKDKPINSRNLASYYQKIYNDEYRSKDIQPVIYKRDKSGRFSGRVRFKSNAFWDYYSTIKDEYGIDRRDEFYDYQREKKRGGSSKGGTASKNFTESELDRNARLQREASNRGDTKELHRLQRERNKL